MGVSLGLVGIVDKGIYNPDETYNKGNFVLHEGSTWLALKDNLQGVEPAEGESWKFLARGFAAEILSLITAVDSAGLVGNAGAETDGQTLLDAIADKVANQLLEKKMMSNVQVNDATMVPTSALVYAMQQALTNLNSNITEQTDLVVVEVTDFVASTATAIDCPWQNYQFLIVTFGMYDNITFSHMVPVSFFKTTTSGKRVVLYNLMNTDAYCQCYQNGEGSIIFNLSPDMVALTNYRVHVYGVIAR